MEDSVQLSRYGVYGVVIDPSGQWLLTRKLSGPYIGSWDLPGGRIEFGETPEQTLERELREEVAIRPLTTTLLQVASVVVDYERHGQLYRFHHTGILYRVERYEPIANATPEDPFEWIAGDQLSHQPLTPFARVATTGLCNCLTGTK